MRTLSFLAVPLACALAACGPSDDEAAGAGSAQAPRGTAAIAGLAEPPLDLGEGLILTVLQRGSGAFVPAGGRVRVHYDASIVAVADEPAEEPAEESANEPGEEPGAAAAQTPAESETAAAAEAEPADAGGAPGASVPAADGAAVPAQDGGDAGPVETTSEAAQSTASAPEPVAAPRADAGPSPDPAAPAGAAAPAAEPTEPALPRRFDSSRVRGVPDTWDLSRTASPRLIEGLRRGLIGLTAGSRLTLRVPAALAWGDEGLRDAHVPPRADVLYEIELLEVLP